ncbi:MAG: efflux RND transporter periplasmic adaptor subunit [Bacteroidota bacterium]
MAKFIFFPQEKKLNQEGKGKKTDYSTADALVVKEINLNQKNEFPGTLVANKEVEIFPERQGKVIAVFFKEGSNVDAGKILVKLNDAILQAQLKKLKVNEDFLLKTEERKRNLLKINGISQQEYEASLAELNNLRSEIEYIKAQIEETEIKAPFTGKIGITNVTEGSYVSTNLSILKIQQNNPIKIDFYIPEKNAQQLKTGDLISFATPHSNKKNSATISAINTGIETDTKQLRVRAIASNNNNELVAGSDVIVFVNFESNIKTILIPTSAVVTSSKGKKVYLYKSGKCQEILIETGTRNEDYVEVENGLKPGDTLLTSGLLQLKQGQNVKLNKVQ